MKKQKENDFIVFQGHHNEKVKKTKKEKYGDENFNNRDKAKETLLNKQNFNKCSITPHSGEWGLISCNISQVFT